MNGKSDMEVSFPPRDAGLGMKEKGNSGQEMFSNGWWDTPEYREMLQAAESAI